MADYTTINKVPQRTHVPDISTVIYPDFVCFSHVLHHIPFHPSPDLPAELPKNARKEKKNEVIAERQALMKSWKETSARTRAALIKTAKESNWGFSKTTENGYYRSTTVTTHYIPYGELRDWLLEHVEPAHRPVVEAYDFTVLAQKMSNAWQVSIADTRMKINSLKRAYDEFYEKVSVPVEQRPWKKARVDV
jgi:hypothetical protein